MLLHLVKKRCRGPGRSFQGASKGSRLFVPNPIRAKNTGQHFQQPQRSTQGSRIGDRHNKLD